MPVLTSDNILSPNCQQTGYLECYIASWIWKIVPLSLVVVGVVGNFTSLIVLSSKQLRKTSTSMYLIFLAVTDATFLCFDPMRHTLKHVFGINTWVPNFFSCSFSGWLMFTCGMTSCWLIVLITAERTMLTLFPITAKPKMTPRNAIIASIVLSIFVGLLNWHFLYGSIVEERQSNTTESNGTSIQAVTSCSFRPTSNKDFYIRMWNKLLVILGSAVPILLIVAGNAIVAISLLKSRRALRRVQQSNGRDVGRMSQPYTRSKVNYKLFFLLCSVYIMSTLPCGIYVNTFPFNTEVDDRTLAKYQLAAVVILCLLWINFSFNFLLYILTGSLFRKEFKKLFYSAYEFFTSFSARSSVQSVTNQNQ